MGTCLQADFDRKSVDLDFSAVAFLFKQRPSVGRVLSTGPQLIDGLQSFGFMFSGSRIKSQNSQVALLFLPLT